MFFIGFANSLTAARVRFRAEKLTSRHTTLHRRRNNDSDRLRRLDERKILVGNDRMAGRGVAEVMNPVASKNTNELKTGAPGPFRSSSTRGEPQIWGSEAMSAIRVPRPVPKLGPFELDHKSAAWCLCLRFLSAPRRRVYPRVGFSCATRTMSCGTSSWI